MRIAAVVQREPHTAVRFSCLESVELSSTGSMFLHCAVFRVQTEGKALFKIIYLCHEFQLYATMFPLMLVPMWTVLLSSSDFSIWIVIRPVW